MSRLKVDKLLVSVHEQQRLERDTENLIRERRMPGLAQLLTVIGETRCKYRPMILAARKGKASQ
jgi:hypothetical protein